MKNTVKVVGLGDSGSGRGRSTTAPGPAAGLVALARDLFAGDDQIKYRYL